MSRGRVFIVDDNPDNIGVLTGLLREHDYEVRMATSGRRALKAVPQFRPHVVVLDIRMPGMDGFEVCQRLNADRATADIPVIFMSALDDLDTRVESFEKGGIDYITKPFDEDEVLARVKRQVAVSRVRQSLKASEAKFRAVTESAADAVISANSAGRIQTWNRSAEALFGYTGAEAVGQPLELIIPERYHEAHRTGMARVSAGGETRFIGDTVELSAVTKEGAEIPVEISLARWRFDDESYYTGIIRDIRERKEAERRLREYAEELHRQHEALQRQHEALHRQQQALIATNRQADRLFAAATAALPGSILNEQYTLHEELAAGGFGIVYRATQVVLERPVAVKVLKPPSAEEAEGFFERFRREGVTACRVTHPNAVAIHDAGVSESGFPFIVMELLEGSTVAHRIKHYGPFRLRRTLEILGDVCAVLAAAHEAGIIHRDVKPSNVFLHRPQESATGRGEVVKVLDFGIAKLLDDPNEPFVTQDNQLLGTPTHMAPERLSGGEQTGRADVYSVAVMMYEMLTGRLPFVSTSKNVWSTIWMHVTESPEPLDAIDPTVPTDVATLALRALDKEPRGRPDAAALEVELRRIADELGPETESGAHRGLPPGGPARQSDLAREGADGTDEPRPRSEDDLTLSMRLAGGLDELSHGPDHSEDR